MLPKDIDEVNRLDFQHYFLRSVLHRDYIAPLPEEIYEILDVGCGTGLWCREMARQFPHTFITGLDLEPPQRRPDDSPLCQFVRGDILKGLPFENSSFDYVHQRLLVAAIPTHAWLFVLKELARVTRRGGWVELLEAGQRFESAGPRTNQFISWWAAFSRAAGFDTGLMERLYTLLHEAGLSSVLWQPIRVPLGAWGGHASIKLATNMLCGFRSLKERMCAALGLPSEEFDALVEALPGEWEQYRTSYFIFVACGRKA